MLDERITASTQRFAVLGESLKHTWSPYIHNSLFAAAGRNAVYLPITVPKHQLSSAVDVLRSCFAGFNVTIPYKELIIPFLDEIDDAVKACGAVNTVENRDGRLIGHITDGLGLLSALRRGGVETNQANVIILGGGGAAPIGKAVNSQAALCGGELFAPVEADDSAVAFGLTLGILGPLVGIHGEHHLLRGVFAVVTDKV